MKERSFKDRLKSWETSSKANAEVADRRTSSRKPVIAAAQVVEVSSGARVRARCCDLALNGCYIDTLNPFQAGTLVRLRLEKGGEIFDGKGKVAYRQIGLGMGIAFIDVTPEGLAVLERWMSSFEASVDPFDSPIPSAKPAQPKSVISEPDEQFADLVQLLERKGILSKSEVVKIMRQTFD